MIPSIQIDDEELYNQIIEIAPSKQSIVKFYQSNTTILKQHRDRSRPLNQFP
jgi:hypothetical protein